MTRFDFFTFPVPFEGDPAAASVTALRALGKTVALAESCTGGLVAKRITDVPGASDVFECGIVSYSSRIKEELLGVSEETLERYSVVSAEVAAEMAEGVRKKASADYGIGITGVAGPGPDGTHPEGEIYVALADKERTRVVRIEPAERGRDQNRELAADQALALLAGALEPKTRQGG